MKAPRLPNGALAVPPVEVPQQPEQPSPRQGIVYPCFALTRVRFCCSFVVCVFLEVLDAIVACDAMNGNLWSLLRLLCHLSAAPLTLFVCSAENHKKAPASPATPVLTTHPQDSLVREEHKLAVMPTILKRVGNRVIEEEDPAADLSRPFGTVLSSCFLGCFSSPMMLSLAVKYEQCFMLQYATLAEDLHDRSWKKSVV